MIYRKYDGSLHWNQTMRRLGEDQHGVWIGSPAPTVMRKGDGPLVTLPHASISLFPRGTWWTASFNGAPASTEIYCDITTLVQWPSPDEVTMVDLDLDVCRKRDGTVMLLDEDEFAEHQVAYGYPAEVISAAEQSARWLQSALGDGSEPFATAYRAYLALVTQDGGLSP